MYIFKFIIAQSCIQYNEIRYTITIDIYIIYINFKSHPPLYRKMKKVACVNMEVNFLSQPIVRRFPNGFPHLIKIN